MGVEFIAHRPTFDKKEQSVHDHLKEVSALCDRLAGKAGVSGAGVILALLHDFGKYSHHFQTYIRSAAGILNPDIDDEYVDAFNRKKKSPEETAKLACKKWLDVRTFGQLFAFKNEAKDGVSIPIQGPVSIQSAFSVDPVSVTSTQTTKSVSGEGDGTKKSSDTMGMKHRVDQAIYVTYGSMNPQLSEKTGFSNTDADVIKSVLPKLFEGDASSARPEGSMAVEKVIWWHHNSKAGQFSSAKVQRSLEVASDGSIEFNNFDGLVPEIIDGF